MFENEWFKNRNLKSSRSIFILFCLSYFSKYNFFFKEIHKYLELRVKLKNEKCKLSYDYSGIVKSKANPPYNDLLDCPESMICDPGNYRCKKYNYCIRIEKLCDGVNDCYLGDDEAVCSEGTVFIIN